MARVAAAGVFGWRRSRFVVLLLFTGTKGNLNVDCILNC